MITADPTWGDIVKCCFKAQSSELERLFCHVAVEETFEFRALSFESFRKCHPTWVGCTFKKNKRCICTRFAYFLFVENIFKIDIQFETKFEYITYIFEIILNFKF